jgi:hypothetical protein
VWLRGRGRRLRGGADVERVSTEEEYEVGEGEEGDVVMERRRRRGRSGRSVRLIDPNDPLDEVGGEGMGVGDASVCFVTLHGWV